jgi:hypothetical protein
MKLCMLIAHAPKEMHEEFHRVRIELDFFSCVPSVKTTKCVPKTKKILVRIKKGIVGKYP